MVTRAINLKVIVPRQADEAGSAAAIWSTHREVNLATRYYEELLLTLRQQPVIYRDGMTQDADEARKRAIELADDVHALRCLIPRFDGAIFSLEWKEALWDKYFTAAPRPRTPSEQQYSDPLADRVMRSMIPRSASYNRGAEPRTRHQCQNSRQVA